MDKNAAPRSFADLINLWPPGGLLRRSRLISFATDIGVPYVTANLMRQRNSVAPKYWDAVLAAADRRGIEGITKELLAELAIARELERQAS